MSRLYHIKCDRCSAVESVGARGAHSYTIVRRADPSTGDYYQADLCVRCEAAFIGWLDAMLQEPAAREEPPGDSPGAEEKQP